ncbi:hypothetical protein NW761_014630 [Fusarium oxysporum]|nr:hypothetical protein NW758_003721 [Fusarium oxysporum]KAJ4072802.1 hypothetical protein NW761_014630 [Fusarium oxysporum]
MHPSQRAASANNPRRRHNITHTRTALVQGRALMLASYIKDIFLRGELLGEGVKPRWTLWGKETQIIAFNKGTNVDHRGRGDEVDANGHNNDDDDNYGDDEQERRFLE